MKDKKDKMYGGGMSTAKNMSTKKMMGGGMAKGYAKGGMSVANKGAAGMAKCGASNPASGGKK